MKDVDSDSGYLVNGPVENQGQGFRVNLVKASSGGMYGESVEELVFEVSFYTAEHLRFKIYDANNQRYEVPVPLNIVGDENLDINDALYEISLLDDAVGAPFGFRVSRRGTGRVIFDTSVSPLVFDNQFLQLSTALTPECSLYGFGENPHTKFRHDFTEDKVFPMFSRDEFPNDGEKNNYGVHPYYQCMEDAEGNTHSVLLFNSNAMEYALYKTGGGIPVVTLRSIGGILDFHMFLGPKPADVTHQYLEMIGRPFLPPYWSLGFQISRWGYWTLDALKVIVERTKAAGIPQDVQYADIDYMELYKDFTYDQENWADLPNYVRAVKEDGLRFVVILDPAIVVDFTDNYPAAKRADEADAFIKWPDQSWVPDDQPAGAKDYMVGYVWPYEKTAFPDFWKNSTQEWWSNEIQILYDTIPFDGLWIDMNEPANFGTNLLQPWNWPDGQEPWSLKCTSDKLDVPPYKYTKVAEQFLKLHSMNAEVYHEFHSLTSGPKPATQETTKVGNLRTRPSAWLAHTQMTQLTHETRLLVLNTTFILCSGGGSQSQPCGNFSRLFGTPNISCSSTHWRKVMMFVMSVVSRAARKATGTRSMVFSRSTYPSSGKTVGHWYGDNTSRWVDLYRSVINMFEFEMFGLPYGGADICGYNENSWEELCLRWMQLGSFYPFSRNHNGAAGNIDQDPAAWDSVAEASRISLNVRYTLLPYLYTLFFNSNTKGDTVVRPFTYEFPSDLVARDVDTQFMWGPHVVFSPILFEESFNSRATYFPQGLWYNYFTKALEFEGPIEVQLEVPDMAVPVHLRGGGIIPTQQPAMNTMLSRRNPFGLLVVLDENKQARGELFWDDGESVDTVDNGRYYLASLSFNLEDGLMNTIEHPAPSGLLDNLFLEEIQILGWEGSNAPTVETNLGSIVSVDVDSASNVLTLVVSIPMGQEFTLTVS